MAALAGATNLLEQFTIPNQTLAAPPAALPERTVVRVVADGAFPAVVGRTDSTLVVGMEGNPPPSTRPGFGVLVVDTQDRVIGVMVYEGDPIPGAPEAGPGIDGGPLHSVDRRSGRSREDHGPQLPDALPGLDHSVRTPRIALGGVVRAWDGAERTGLNSAYVRSVARRVACRSS